MIVIPYYVYSSWYTILSIKSEIVNRTSVSPAFTYVGKEIIFITKLFRYYRLKVAFRSNNSVGTLLRKKNQPLTINI